MGFSTSNIEEIHAQVEAQYKKEIKETLKKIQLLMNRDKEANAAKCLVDFNNRWASTLIG